MSVETRDETNEARFDEMLAEMNTEREKELQGAEHSVAAVIGDFTRIDGHPGWYIRAMKGRQQIRLIEMLESDDAKTTSQITTEAFKMATLVTYRLDRPSDFQRVIFETPDISTLFKQADTDALLDNFTIEEVNDLILRPSGLFRSVAGDPAPNAESPDTNESSQSS